jgi:hypothetical protein
MVGVLWRSCEGAWQAWDGAYHYGTYYEFGYSMHITADYSKSQRTVTVGHVLCGAS